MSQPPKRQKPQPKARPDNRPPRHDKDERPARSRSRHPAGWDPVANWYDGWVGEEGSDHHRNLAIPHALELLDLKADENLLDVGAGQGVLVPHAIKAHARYTGVDVSTKLLTIAKQRHSKEARFLQGDARKLAAIKGIDAGAFDAVVFMLSIEDIDPLAQAVDSAAWALREGGRLVILMRHPAFRVPRQSGWGFDQQRELQYRRVDSYLTPMRVPMKSYAANRPRQNRSEGSEKPKLNAQQERAGVTISFHRPLSQYVTELVSAGLVIDAMREVPTHKPGKSPAEQRANEEIPLFLALRARKLTLNP